MTNYADPTISLADHLAAALKPIDRNVVALALADALGSRVRSGERSVLANALLNGTGIDSVLDEIRDLLDGTTAIEPKKTKCLKCHGRGERVHGWAMCPAPCKDCDGTGEVLLDGTAAVGEVAS